MSKKNETSPLTCLPSSVTRTQIKRYTLLVALLWFVVVMVSMTLGIVMKKRETRESARIQARSAFEKDILYRRWNAMHGGLYAPITGITPANPYLKIPEREINTPSGKELTKINPAYMTRQVHELGRLQKGVQGHITSLKPIRPQNNPDPWEREALEAFESGAKEVNSIETMDSVVYMRLMRPLVTETGCLKCHAQQGYKEGDIRGGISISVPMEPLLAIARPQLTLITLAHLLLLMIGLCGILLGSKVINRRLHEQELAEAALVDSQQKTNAANIQLQAALKEVKNLAKEAEAANETKSLFLANMSHEIRTPMNGILGITKLLFETNLSDDQRYFSSLIRNSGDALLVVINDILDFSKIEAGKLDLEIIDFNLRSTLNDITDIMALKAEQKKLEFICFVDPKVPSLLRGDPGRLRQVILNLIGNAFKFTPHGEVVVNVNLEKESDDEAVIRFTVSDTGIGIKKDQLNALFDAFTQADLSTTRKYGGTGLGLTISKELVEKMGSHLQVESSDGEGATFFFTVPFKKQAHITEPEAEERLQINGEKILVVDDNETNRKLLEKILLAWGFNVDEACDGFSALEKLHSAAAGNDPFVIAILDMQMPEMDGESLGKKIKETISLSKTILIMMTSMGKRGDSSRLEEIGFSVYLHKPVIESRLFNCLMEVLKRDVGLEKPEHSIITKYSITEIIQQNSKLLLVEDNETNRVVALKLLEKLGYNADVAGNGKEALDALANKKYDLVLMDCQMPVMDGYEATREIRAREKKEYEQMDQNVPIAHIPILAMTADAMEGAQKKCIEAGMDDYISKPVKDSQLQKAISKWLPDSKKPLPAHSNAPSLYKDDNETVFSKTDLLKRFMGDVEFAENILTVFLSDIEKQFTAMRKEVNNQNFAQIKNHAHTIKGAASNISCLSLAAASAKVERAAADKECQLTLSLFSDMELQFKKLKSEMKKTDFHS